MAHLLSMVSNVEEVNDKGGVNGKKVSIVVADSKSEPAEAANAMSKLVNQDKTPVVMGIFTSSSAIAAANVSEAAKVHIPGNWCN